MAQAEELASQAWPQLTWASPHSAGTALCVPVRSPGDTQGMLGKPGSHASLGFSPAP